MIHLPLLWHEGFGHRGSAVAGSAGDRIGGHAIAQLGEVFGVEIGGHFDHDAGFFFDGIRIGGEVVALGLLVPGVAECAFDTKVPLVLMHEFDDVVASDVFRKSLDVGGIGTWSPRLAGPGGLRA